MKIFSNTYPDPPAAVPLRVRQRSEPIVSLSKQTLGPTSTSNASPCNRQWGLHGRSTFEESPNDARDMAASLKALGFDVTSGITWPERMKRLIREFGLKLKNGVQVCFITRPWRASKGRNYLVPVDA